MPRVTPRETIGSYEKNIFPNRIVFDVHSPLFASFSPLEPVGGVRPTGLLFSDTDVCRTKKP